MPAKWFVNIIFVMFFVCGCCTSYVFASDILDKQLEILNIDSVNNSLIDLTKDSGNPFAEDFNLSDIAVRVITGKLDISFSSLVNTFAKFLIKEILEHIYLMRNIIVIAILSAILNILTSSFNGRGVGELSFYVCYILLVILLFRSFGICADLAMRTVDFLCKAMLSLIPVFIILLISSGNAAMAAVFNPIVIFAVNGISLFIKNVIITLVTLAAALQIINYLSSRQILNQLTELLKKGSSWILKGCAILFMSVLSIQRISAPIMNSVANKSAKLVVNAIPVVGEVLSGSVDTVFYWAGAVKNGVSVSAVIFIALICTAPIIKLLALVIIYKITAAIVQPVSDERIVKCLDAASSFAGILLSALITVAVMFIFSIIIVISTGIPGS